MKRGALASLWLLAAATLCGSVCAAPDVLQRFAGEWDVTVSLQKPVKATVHYSESAVLAPGGKLLRSGTSVKPDGTQDWSMMIFDRKSGGYPLWIFSSTGATFFLAPGMWNEDTSSIVWKEPPASPVSHRTSCTFENERTRVCETQVKDWKGSVLLEQSYRAVRRDR